MPNPDTSLEDVLPHSDFTGAVVAAHSQSPASSARISRGPSRCRRAGGLVGSNGLAVSSLGMLTRPLALWTCVIRQLLRFSAS